ncbi:reverse transcriptase [Cucumis melo var. makuwa]|uniref:Reverse transcriptase n=1 Tax=Cucumis melo var. makuwa TaxID=1194695 RepID=A0A5A7TCL9_CUCMM|nr:reverse transcriptase [Cucumis melo var. makuwa]TYK00510.1 reverse transcriptase [Cucumis melo var. makuwa]
MDVKSAFLNRHLEKEVYLEQLPGYSVNGQEDKVLKLKKALYRLKQAPRMWNSRINKYFLDNGYLRCPYEHSLYIKGWMSYYLRIEMKQSEEGIFISQERYTREILEKFNMINSKLVTTPIEIGTKLSKYEEGDDVDPSYFKSLVGNLRYLTCTRPDILFSVGLNSNLKAIVIVTGLEILMIERALVDMFLHWQYCIYMEF